MWKHNIGVPCLCRNASYINFKKWNISCPNGTHRSISSSNTCRACNCAQPHVTGHVWHVTRAIHYNNELHCDQSASPIAATSPRYRDQPKEMWSQTSLACIKQPPGDLCPSMNLPSQAQKQDSFMREEEFIVLEPIRSCELLLINFSVSMLRPATLMHKLWSVDLS